jgi:SAM-dependent methyltransferase
MSRWFYEILYARFRAPWDIGPRQELVELVESGRIQPSRAIDLGSGTASNVIFLAQRGFDVTGVDFAQAAIELGRKRAREANVTVDFIRDDLTHLQHVQGSYDLLVDYGTLDDIPYHKRDLYIHNILPLTHPGSQFLLYCFEWEMRWWERLLTKLFSAFGSVMKPGEVEQRFGAYFEIEKIAEYSDGTGWPRGAAVYLMVQQRL